MELSEESTKDEVKEYLGEDLIDELGFELGKNGMIFEAQYPELGSMFCKLHASTFCEIMKEQVDLEVFHGYVNPEEGQGNYGFYFYNLSKYPGYDEDERAQERAKTYFSRGE